MNLKELEQQYHGTTLPKLIEKQIRSLKKEVLLKAIRGTFNEFDLQLRPQLDTFTEEYLENWFSSNIINTDLGEVFSVTIKDIKSMASQFDFQLNDDRVFDLFNIMVMKLSYFAHSDPTFRKMLGIKKSWFS